MFKAQKVRVTRDVDIDAEGNYAHRDVWEGEILYTCIMNTYGCIGGGGIALTEKTTGDYPFFEFPRDAVEFVNDSSSSDQPEVPA